MSFRATTVMVLERSLTAGLAGFFWCCLSPTTQPCRGSNFLLHPQAGNKLAIALELAVWIFKFFHKDS